MALTKGTNCGFVTTAPTTDPGSTNITIDAVSMVMKDISPANSYKITEVGWYASVHAQSVNFEVGLYEANGTTVPGEAGGLTEVSRTNSSSGSSGWQVKNGLNWIITPNTKYWLGFQLDDTTVTSNTAYSMTGGLGRDALTSQTTLPSPFAGGTLLNASGLAAVYAIYETVPAGIPYALSGCWALSGSTANSGSLTIDVPTGATLALIGVTGYKNEAYYFTSGSVTLGGSAMSLACQADSDTTKYQGTLFYLKNPTAGSQTLAYDWYGANAPTNYPMFIGCFYANTHSTTPIRSSGSQQVTSGTATTGSMTGQANDMAVAFGFGYTNTAGADVMAFTSGSEILEAWSGKSQVGWAHGYHNGNVTMTRTDNGPLDDGGICGVILMPAPAANLSGSQININDSWKALAAYSINIGDVWKSVSAAQINIGDVWKPITI